MTGQGLSLDAWSEVVEHVVRDDLPNLCLVSRLLKAVATRVLYRSITLQPRLYNLGLVETPVDQSQLPQSEQRGHWHLLSRLGNKENQSLRNLVQEVILLRPSNEAIPLDKAFLNHLRKDDHFPKLLTRLPNLRRVTIGIPELQTDNVIHTLCTHGKKPELSLILDGYDERISTDSPLPCISSLDVAGDPRSYRKESGLLKFQQLVFNSPNLRSLSIAVLDKYDGRMRRPRRAGMHLTFYLKGDERFPPLEELALNGYVMKDGEASVWQRNAQWEKLASLTVGPLPCWSVLPGFAGYATALKTLKVYTYHRMIGGEEARIGLEALLGSFDGLEVLDVKGFICSVSAVGQHRNLAVLCLHEDEPQRDDGDAVRTVLTPADISYLDEHCPKISSLALDVQRGNGELDEKALQAIVTGFRSLRHLSIHFEMGLRDIRRPITPVINSGTAQNIGQDIFDRRKQIGSSLLTLTLWTGSSYRRRLYWKPKYLNFERRFTASYTLRQGEGLISASDLVTGEGEEYEDQDEDEDEDD